MMSGLGRIRKRIAVRAFILASLLIGALSPRARAGEGIDELVEAVAKDAPKMRLIELAEKYQNKTLRGWAWVVSTTKDVDGNTVVTLSTEKDLYSDTRITIVVILRQFLSEKNVNFPPGDHANFLGIFKEIRMGTIVLTEGIVQ
jgi:hypothetical protein